MNICETQVRQIPTTSSDPSLTLFVDRVIRARRRCDVEEIERLYDGSAAIFVVDGPSSIGRVTLDDLLAALRARRDWSDPDEEACRLLHVERQGDQAIAWLDRSRRQADAPDLLELRMRRDRQGWRVTGETVTVRILSAGARVADAAAGPAAMGSRTAPRDVETRGIEKEDLP